MCHVSSDSVSVDRRAAEEYLRRDPHRNLPLLAALSHDPLLGIHGMERERALVALALVVESFGSPGRPPTVMVAADDRAALESLLGSSRWPQGSAWAGVDHDLLPSVEALCGRRQDVQRGLIYYVATAAPASRAWSVRRLEPADSEALDLSQCRLSPTALVNWLAAGWRVFGVVDGDQLLAHALAAYPVEDTEEISSVFTAPAVRRRGLASAVVVAAIGDIVARGRRAVYVCRRANKASQLVAEGVGMERFLETWDIP